MIRIIALIRPHKLEEVKTAVSALGISGMTVTDARGSGTGPERATLLGGSTLVVNLSLRSRLEVIAHAELKEPILAAIQQAAHTGEDGDGKVFVEEVADVLRIRTGERGRDAL